MDPFCSYREKCTFAKLRKATMRFITSVCLSVTMVTRNCRNVTLYVPRLSYYAGIAPSGSITGDEFPDYVSDY
jgi:hypothetical protein